jgi:hypothetical protein
MNPEAFRMLFYSLNGRAPEASPTSRSDFDITTSRHTKRTSILKGELVELIEDSVFKQLCNKKEIWLSLSAGYDATSILGACLSKGLKPKCFSYGETNPPPFSDVFVAQKMAETAGLHHEIWPMDKYPTQDLQLANARMFDQRANRCGEIGAWIYFEKEVFPKLTEKPLFVFGDECFGWSDCRLRNPADVLRSIGIQPDPSLVGDIVLPDKWEDFQEWYQGKIKMLFLKADHLKELHNKKDYLYFHERLQMVIMPWREKFAGRYGQFCTPLLSHEILSFVGALPLPLRIGKKLMKEAVHERYAKLFRFKRARTSGAPLLRQTSCWPPEIPRARIKHMAKQFFLREETIGLFEDSSKSLSSNSVRENAFGGLKKLLRGSFLMSFYQVSRRFMPPVFNVPRDLVLSRIQIWLLRDIFSPKA